MNSPRLLFSLPVTRRVMSRNVIRIGKKNVSIALEINVNKVEDSRVWYRMENDGDKEGPDLLVLYDSASLDELIAKLVATKNALDASKEFFNQKKETNAK